MERCERWGGVVLHNPRRRTRSPRRRGTAWSNRGLRWSSRPGATPSSARRLKLPVQIIDDEPLQACWPSTVSTLLLLGTVITLAEGPRGAGLPPPDLGERW